LGEVVLNKKYIAPYVALVVGVVSVSCAAIFVKLAGSTPASIIANYRLLLAVLLMTPYILLTKRYQEFKHISKRDFLLSACAGVFLAFHFIFWFESLQYTSVASSVVLVTMQPIFAFLGTYFFFHERFSFGAIVSMILAIFGSIIISWGDFQISGLALLGDILALLGAIMMTGYFLLGQSVRQRLSLGTYTYVVYGISAITLILYNIILKQEFSGYSWNVWFIFLALAIIPTFLGHSLFNYSLKWISTSTISMAMLFEPVGASILAYIVLHEQLTWSQILGGSIVIIGLLIFSLSTSKTVAISKNEEEI